MQIQTLKAGLVPRIDTGRSTTLYSAARDLGESLMCPASAQHIRNDIYGRPASQQTLPVNLDASCAQGSMYPANRMIAVENQARPYIPICSAGLRGASDGMGVGRDLIPQDLYGFGNEGNFVRTYPTKNDAPWDLPPPPQTVGGQRDYYFRVEQPFTMTHDASRSAYYSG